MSTKESAERGSKVTAEQIRSFGGCKKCNCWKIFCEHARHGELVPVLIDGEWYWGDRPPVEAPACCKDCSNELAFSCRELGSGYCHPCAHKHYMRLTDETEITSQILDGLFPVVMGRGYVVNEHLSIFNTRHGRRLYAGQCGADDSEDSFAIADLKTVGQLRALCFALNIPLDESEK